MYRSKFLLFLSVVYITDLCKYVNMYIFTHLLVVVTRVMLMIPMMVMVVVVMMGMWWWWWWWWWSWWYWQWLGGWMGMNLIALLLSKNFPLISDWFCPFLILLVWYLLILSLLSFDLPSVSAWPKCPIFALPLSAYLWLSHFFQRFSHSRFFALS